MKIENCARFFRGKMSQCDPSLYTIEFTSVHDVATFLVQTFISGESNPSEISIHAYLDNQHVLNVTLRSYLVTYSGNFTFDDYTRGVQSYCFNTSV